MDEVEAEQQQSLQRLRDEMDRIIDKYSHEFEDTDVIDLEHWQVIEDYGLLRAVPAGRFGLLGRAGILGLAEPDEALGSSSSSDEDQVASAAAHSRPSAAELQTTYDVRGLLLGLTAPRPAQKPRSKPVQNHASSGTAPPAQARQQKTAVDYDELQRSPARRNLFDRSGSPAPKRARHITPTMVRRTLAESSDDTDTLLFDEDESDDDRRDTQRKAADITPPRSKCGGPGYCQKSFCFSCSLAQADDSSGEG